MTEERWLPVPYEGYPYDISDRGRVRRSISRTCTKAGHILQCCPDATGYMRVTLCKPGGRKLTAKIATMVCLAFNGPKPSPKHVVAHDDGNRTNNVYTNLIWKTGPENELDKRRHGRIGIGVANGRAKLSDEDVVAIFALLMTDRFSKTTIAAMFGVTDGLINHIEHGRAWTHLRPTWFKPVRIKNTSVA